MTEQGTGIKVLVTDDLHSSVSRLESTAILHSLPDLALIPVSWEISGGNRKFVVLGREPRSVEDVALVIGPDMHQPGVEDYYHKELRAWAQSYVVAGAGAIFGGGAVDFKGRRKRAVRGLRGEQSIWTAMFGGSSGDFGVFSPALLFFKVDVSKALGMNVSFDWRSSHYL